MASTRFVLPCPLRPMNAVAPGSSDTSAAAYDRKSTSVRRSTYTSDLLDQQVEQPRADHRALAPGVEHLGDVLDEVGPLEQLPSLGIGLHDGVLDAVVDHLREVSGAGLRAGMDEPAFPLGLEGVEGR